MWLHGMARESAYSVTQSYLQLVVELFCLGVVDSDGLVNARQRVRLVPAKRRN